MLNRIIVIEIPVYINWVRKKKCLLIFVGFEGFTKGFLPEKYIFPCHLFFHHLRKKQCRDLRDLGVRGENETERFGWD